MDEQRRRDLATGTVGLGGLFASGAMRHQALEQAYNGGKRPPLAQELKLLRRGTKGRKLYTAASVLGLASATPAVVGTTRFLTPRKQGVEKRYDRTKQFILDSAEGTKESYTERTDTVKHPAPAKLMVGNYAGGVAIGSGTGALVHRSLKNKHIHGAVRSGLAVTAGTAVGSATLPLQSKIMEHITHGKYETTATGVKRAKTKAIRPSAKASMVERRYGQDVPVHKSLKPHQISALIRAQAKTVFHGTEDFSPEDIRRANYARARLTLRNRGALYRAQGKSNPDTRGLHEVVDQFSRKNYWMDDFKRSGVGKAGVAKYYGEDLTDNQKRRRVAAAASSSVPFASDIAAAGAAGRMAPPGRRKQSAAYQWGGAQAGGVTGQIVGGYGAAALASKSPKFKAGMQATDKFIDSKKADLRAKLGMDAKVPRPSRLAQVAESTRTPQLVKRAIKPLVGHGRVATVGALGLGWAGGIAGGSTGYKAALKQEHKYVASHPKDTQSAHGSRVAKADIVQQSKRKQAQTARRKEHSAALSMASSATGIGALGSMAGSRIKQLSPKVRGHLKAAQVPLLTLGAGIGAINGIEYARIQRQEAKSSMHKGLIPRVHGISMPQFPRNTMVPGRARTMRAGSIRQTRTRTGITTSTVRGAFG